MAETTTAALLDAVDLRVATLMARVRALAAEREASGHQDVPNNGSGPLPLFPEIQAAVAPAVSQRPAPASLPVQDAGSPSDVHCEFPQIETDSVAPDRLRIQMNYAGLTKAAFAEVFGVPAEVIESWLNGERPIPAWVLPAVYIFELLTPAERRSFLRPAAARSGRNPAKVHPFARIEEL